MLSSLLGSADGIMFSCCPARASVCPSVMLFTLYLQCASTDSLQPFATGASWDKDALIWFGVKGQGHRVDAYRACRCVSNCSCLVSAVFHLMMDKTY